MNKHCLNMRQKFELANWIRSNSMEYTSVEAISIVERDLGFTVTETNLTSVAKACNVTFKKKTRVKKVRTEKELSSRVGQVPPGTATKILARYIMRLYDAVDMPYDEDLIAIAKARKILIEKSTVLNMPSIN